MSGGKNKIHEHPKAGTNDFSKRPHDAGRPKGSISFKKRYQEVLSRASDAVMWFDESELQRQVVDGVNQVGIKLSGVQSMLLRLDNIIHKGNDSTALNAIKFIWEQMDGKAIPTNNMGDDSENIVNIVIK